MHGQFYLIHGSLYSTMLHLNQVFTYCMILQVLTYENTYELTYMRTNMYQLYTCDPAQIRQIQRWCRHVGHCTTIWQLPRAGFGCEIRALDIRATLHQKLHGEMTLIVHPITTDLRYSPGFTVSNQ